MYNAEDMVFRFVDEAKKSPPLSTPVEQRLARCIQGQWSAPIKEKAVGILVRHNILFAFKEVKKFSMPGMERSDLLGEAMLWMIMAAHKFQPGRGRFISYAVWYIKRGVGETAASSSRSVRLPYGVAQALVNLKRFHAATGTDPRKASNDDIRSALKLTGLSQGSYDDALNAARPFIPVDLSLNMSVGPTGARKEDRDEYIDFVPAVDQMPDEQANTDMMAANIDRMLAGLTKRERKVIRLRYLDKMGAPSTRKSGGGRKQALPRECYSLEEIGAEIGVTRERVRQLLLEIHKKLLFRHGTELKELYESCV